MATCNKCGYDKAVHGLVEIWCDKCDSAPQDFTVTRASVDVLGMSHEFFVYRPVDEADVMRKHIEAHAKLLAERSK